MQPVTVILSVEPELFVCEPEEFVFCAAPTIAPPQTNATIAPHTFFFIVTS
jgi:hypothetical protein